MSKRRKQQQKSIKPVAWFIGGGILLIAAASFLAFGGGGNGGGTPALAVDQQVIDYGDVKLNTNLTFEINVTNTGDGTLRFKEEPYIQVLEGCWPPSLSIGSMVLKPGESTTIQSSVFMMHAGMEGPHDFRVHLITNDPAQPEKEVKILSNWVQ